MGKAHSRAKSFYYAFSGLKEALKEEPNLRIHFLAGILTLTLAYFLNFSYVEFLILIITISFVIVIELINTVLEIVVDLASPEIQEKARIAKDISAACVLIAAILASLVGITLFLPKILLFF